MSVDEAFERIRIAREEWGWTFARAQEHFCGRVYFFHSQELESIKIGFSCDPWQRLRTIRNKEKISLRILNLCEGDRQLERKIQKRFGIYLLNGRGREWFRDVKEIREYAAQLPFSPSVNITSPDWRLYSDDLRSRIHSVRT